MILSFVLRSAIDRELCIVVLGDSCLIDLTFNPVAALPAETDACRKSIVHPLRLSIHVSLILSCPKATSQGLVEHQQRAAAQIGILRLRHFRAPRPHFTTYSRHPAIFIFAYTSVECMAGMCILSNSERQVKHYDDPV